MTRELGAGIALVLAVGVVSAFVVDDGDGTVDAARAERCGIELAEHVGLDATGASASGDGDSWRVTAVVSGGALRIDVRGADRRVLDATMIGPGGPQPLDRESRLAIFERGC